MFDVDVIEVMGCVMIVKLLLEFVVYFGEMVFMVEEFVDDVMLVSLGIEYLLDLLGLYYGWLFGEKLLMDMVILLDWIVLYCCVILDEWIEIGVWFDDLVVYVMIYEIGYYFGLSDDDMYVLEDVVGV